MISFHSCDLSQELCHVLISFQQIYSVFPIEILDFPYLPFITKKPEAAQPSLCYVTLFNRCGDRGSRQR